MDIIRTSTQEQGSSSSSVIRIDALEKNNKTLSLNTDCLIKIHALIIDDDVYSTFRMENIFGNFGCAVESTNDPLGAPRKIETCVPNLIILDWMLDTRTGRDVIDEANLDIQVTESLQDKFNGESIKVITYSALKTEIPKLPKYKYFEQIDHWVKPMSYEELSEKTAKLLFELGA